jgi:hypothetical protein
VTLPRTQGDPQLRSYIEQRAHPIDWAQLVNGHQVILLGENHTNLAVREFLATQARQLRSAGITHYGIEAPADSIFDRLNGGEHVSLKGVTVGPFFDAGYETVIRAFAAEGIAIVPVDIDQSTGPTSQEREEHIAREIAAVVNGAEVEDASGQMVSPRMAVLIGGFHAADFEMKGTPSTYQQLRANGISVLSTSFVGGNSRLGTLMLDSARSVGMDQSSFVLDVEPYTSAGGRGMGQLVDALIHLPQREELSMGLPLGGLSVGTHGLRSFSALQTERGGILLPGSHPSNRDATVTERVSAAQRAPRGNLGV